MSSQQQVLANGCGMEEFLSEFLSVYTCGAYGSSSSNPATAQFNKPKCTASVDTTAASSTTTTTLAKNDGSGAMEEFISEFVSFYSCNVGLPTLPPPQPSSAENNEEAPHDVSANDGQLVANDDDEEGVVEEFLREFIAFYSMGTIGTTDPTSTTNNATTNNEPSIEKAKAYYPASSPTESNPGKSTSEEDMGMMKEFLREFVAFYTLQGEDVVAPVGGESPMFAPAVSPEEENAGAADNNNNNSPAIAEESRNDTPTVDDDDDTEDEEEEDDTNVIEAVANNTDNGLPFPLNTMENKPASSPTASSSSSSSTKQKKKSSRSFVPKKMKKLFSSKKKSASAQAVQ